MKKKQRVTGTDVANSVGVSRAVVSAVMSGSQSTIRVGEETRMRVLGAARELNYKPSMLGRSLVEGKSFLVAILCRSVFSEMLLDFIMGVQDAADSEDYSVLVYCHHGTLADEEEHLNRAIEREVDGLIVMPAMQLDGRSNAQMFRSLEKDGTSVVQVFGHLLPGLRTVSDDVKTSGYLACRHLIDLGHKRIAHFTHPEYEDRKAPGSYLSARQRYEGYLSAMQEAGLEPIIVLSKSTPGLPADHMQAAYDCARDVIDHPAKPTGVVANNDYYAAGLIKGLVKLGLRVPDDISLVGADNRQCALACNPALTTLAPPIHEMGQEALKMLVRGLQGQEEGRDVVFQPKLIVRESTSRPRTT